MPLYHGDSTAKLLKLDLWQVRVNWAGWMIGVTCSDSFLVYLDGKGHFVDCFTFLLKGGLEGNFQQLEHSY